MLINIKNILQEHNISLLNKGIINIGTHYAQEHEEYLRLGVNKFVYIEPCSAAFKKLYARFQSDSMVKLFNVACADYNGCADMYVSIHNLGMSNSLLEPKLHLIHHPDIIFDEKETVNVIRLDDLLYMPLLRPIGDHNEWIVSSEYNFLYMDTQGAEGLILKGAVNTLKNIDIIYMEVNRGETYKENMLIDDIDKLLNNFERVNTIWPIANNGSNCSWGDALYLRNK